MSANVILVNTNRCCGCWTCSLACKQGNQLPDGVWWQHVRTLGDGRMDEPAGEYPNLSMSWMPVYTTKCILCSKRTQDSDELPYCVLNCPTNALTYGDIDDKTSPVNVRISELKQLGYCTYQLPEWECTKPDVVYIHQKLAKK